MKRLSILIPTAHRIHALTTTLATLGNQIFRDFDIMIADQSDDPMKLENTSFDAVVRWLEYSGHKVDVLRNIPFRGMAQQRQFLFEQVVTPFCLYLDDDLLCDAWSIDLMMKMIQTLDCGFVGMAVTGLSFIDDIRLDQQEIEFWNGEVKPEVIVPGTRAWNRYRLHNAANMLHVTQTYGITVDKPRVYNVAWVGGCTLYDTQKLRKVGAFDFWDKVPLRHCGEDVYAQLRVMKHYGGAGVLPSGVHHQELETTIQERRFNIPEHLPV